MKIFISADIEGVLGINHWDEDSDKFAKRMNQEVIAACEGAIEGGATEVFVKDAHANGRTIDPYSLPEQVKLIRGKSSSPKSMVEQIDDTFDAIAFIGYHSASGTDTNPLAHTHTTSVEYIKINGEIASEFTLNSLIAAYYGVPSIFISGDEGLINQVKQELPFIETVAINQGFGNATITLLGAKESLSLIKAGMKKAVINSDKAKTELPEYFEVEVSFRDHTKALRASFYPGAKKIGPKVVVFESDDYYEVMRFKYFTF